jgi:hypothetical protein
MSVAIVQACTLLHRAEAAGSNKSRLQTPGFRLQEKKRPGKASDPRLQASGEEEARKGFRPQTSGFRRRCKEEATSYSAASAASVST